LQEQIQAILTEETGTVSHPKMLGESLEPVKAPAGQSVSKGRKRRSLEGTAIPAATLQHGSEVYLRRCAQCHGVTGDGAGPAAATLLPKPRDYRKGIFKFTSTPYSSRPHRDDLVRVLRRGIAGTSMP